MSEISNDTSMMGLNKIAIVCNSPVNQSKKLNSNPPDYNAFATAKACGFNVVMYPGSDVEPNEWIEYMDKALFHCKKLGIKLISNSPILNYTGKNRTDWPEAFIQHYIPTKGPKENLTPKEKEFQDALIALVGWQVKDEPLYYDWTKDYPYYYKKFANGKSSIILPNEVTPDDLELLGKETEPKLLKFDCGKILDNYGAIKGIDPNRLLFCNLAVDNDSKWIGHNSTYEEYLDEYIATFRPPLLSFDYYPIDTDKSTKKPHLHKDTFFDNLLMFANKSKQYNIPFWAYCLCLEHSTGEEGRDYPYPTEGMMRFEAFSALAFGAQGIVYWQYRLDDLNSGTSSSQSSQSRPTLSGGTQSGSADTIGSKTLMETGKGVPVFGDNVTTSVWQSIRNINRDIIKYNDVFFNCKFIKHQFLEDNIEHNMNGEAGGIDKIKISGPGFLMTHIETPDPEYKFSDGEPFIHEYIVIVNLDPLNSQDFQWKEVQNETTSHEGLNDMVTEFNENDDNYDGYSDGDYKDAPQETENEWKSETIEPGGWKIIEI
ncbi:MAG: beta-galactosidase [Lepagella sp.]